MRQTQSKTGEPQSDNSRPRSAAAHNKNQLIASKVNPLWQNIAMGRIQRMCTACEAEEKPPENTVQTKLSVGPADDPLEREADAVAEQVLRQPLNNQQALPKASYQVPAVQRQNNQPDEEEILQSKPLSSAFPPVTNHVAKTISAPGAGAPLSEHYRARIEPVLGSDLSHARVHNNIAAQQAASDINARAFTHKNNIFLGSNQSTSDIGLMAHEATHTVQQQVSPIVSPVHRSPLDPANEAAWSFIGPEHRRTTWSKESYLETLSAAAGASMDIEAEVQEAGEPGSQDEKSEFARRAQTLVRLNALGLMAAHRTTIVARQQETVRSFEDRTAPEGEFDRQVSDGQTTLKRIREAGTKVHQLEQLRQELTGYRRELSTISSIALINSRSWTSWTEPGFVNELYNRIYDASEHYNSVSIRNYLRRTARAVFGESRSAAERRASAHAIADYLERWRQGQIDGINLSLSQLYEVYPFFSELDAEDFEQGDYAQDTTLEQAVRAAYDETINDIDDAIVDIGSGDIHPFNLPEAINVTKSSMPQELQDNFQEVIRDHEQAEFWKTLGLSAAQIALVFVPVVGPALALGLGVVDLAIQTEELLDELALSDAATNPEGELLGVGGPGSLDWALLAVTAILTAADLGMVAREFRATRGAMALESLRLGEGSIDEITSLIDDLAIDPSDVGRLGEINDQTLAMFKDNPELLRTLSDNPLAARLLKHCASPCWPEDLADWVVEYLDDLMGDLNAKGLTLEDIGTSSDALSTRLAAVDSDEGYTRIFNDLEDGLGRVEHIADETRRGAPLFNDSDLGSAIDDGIDYAESAVMTTKQGAHDVGVAEGRRHALNVTGLQDGNWVNPFEFRRSRFGQGFDDVMQDSAGNLWIVEYKGGTAQLSSGQMSGGWVRSRIARYRREGGDLGRFWADRLEDALNSGRLRGIALSTPIEGRTVGVTVELGRWVY